MPKINSVEYDSALSGPTGARYDDPLQYYRITDRFLGGNNTSFKTGDLRWSSAGVNVSNMTLTNTSDGAFGVKGITSNPAQNDVTRWSLYNKDIGKLRAGMRITIRIRPRAGASSDMAFAFGVQDGTGSNPLTTTDVEFVGFRHQSTVDGNVYAVVKDGTLAAGKESVVNLGALDTTNWTTYQMEVGATGMTAYKDGTLMGSTDLSNFDTSPTYASYMMAYTEGATVGSDRIVDITLWDLIIPTGGW